MPDEIALDAPEPVTTDKNVTVPGEAGYDPRKPRDVSPIVETKTEPEKEPVSLKVWAKTSEENRKLRADVAKLTADLETASKGNSQEAINAAVMEVLKKPGIGKLLNQAGISFNTISDEYLADPEPENPEAIAQKARIDALERSIKDKEELETKTKNDAQAAADAAKVEENKASISKHVEAEGEKIVSDEKDPRNGTPRWVMVAGNSDLIAEAHDTVVKFLIANQVKIPQEKQAEFAPKLIEQALDKIEIRERGPLTKRLAKLVPAKIDTTNSGKKEVRDTDWRPKNVIPSLTIDRSAVSGAAPVKEPKRRFTSGPSKIIYTSDAK